MKRSLYSSCLFLVFGNIHKNVLSSLEDYAILTANRLSIENDILADFLRKHRAEAEEMCWWEYNEELHLKNVLEEGREMERENTERERLRADHEKTRADHAEARADHEKTRADHAEARADHEKTRADQAEAELRALRKELENYRRGNPDTK